MFEQNRALYVQKMCTIIIQMWLLLHTYFSTLVWDPELFSNLSSVSSFHTSIFQLYLVTFLVYFLILMFSAQIIYYKNLKIVFINLLYSFVSFCLFRA